MIDLPQELTVTKDDLAGKYGDNLDCPLARALKRAGVPISYENGYSVAGTRITRHTLGERSERVGFYVWDTGEGFHSLSLREGRLIRCG